ncbi:MAG: SMU1112c/YaeR family gloxylase I-like metalloprotein [Verrucomicrobiales bacterium]|nr:VOC family protein [Verrucomicrobiota bacterium JB025]
MKAVHHIAIIAGDYRRSKRFYTEVMGFPVIREVHRRDRGSYKLDLQGPGGVEIELFSFPDPPARVDGPEACGLRHLAFSTEDLDAEIARLEGLGVAVEPVRTDEFDGCRYTFFKDPDGLPLELKEAPR